MTDFRKTVDTGVDPRLAVITNVSRILLSWVVYSAIREQLHNGMYVFVLFVQIRFTAGIITCSIRLPQHHNIFSLHPNCRINDVCDAGIRPLLTKVYVCSYFLLEKKLALNLHCRTPVTRTLKGNSFELVGIRVIGVDWIFNLLCDFLELHWVYTIEYKITYFIDKTVTWLRDLLW